MTFSTVKYLVDNFSKDLDVSKSNFERVVFDLFSLMIIAVHDNGLSRYGEYGDLKNLAIN